MDYMHTARSVEDRLLSYKKDESGWKTCKKTVSIKQKCLFFFFYMFSSGLSLNKRVLFFSRMMLWCVGDPLVNSRDMCKYKILCIT